MVWVALGPCVIGSQLSEYCFSLKDQTTSDSNRYWASARSQVYASEKPDNHGNTELGIEWRAQLRVDTSPQLSEYCFSLKDQTTSDSNRYWASILGLFP
jgi:hypothetical protein